MFNWTTTTIINSLQDYTTNLPLIKVWESKGDADEAGLIPGFSGQYPVVKIKRDHTFEARYISKIYKALANDPILCEITVDCDKVKSLVADLVDTKDYPVHSRLSFYVALEGSEESIYANDWYQKGKPFSIGFDIAKTDDGAKIAAKIKKNAEKYGVVMYGKKIFDITVDGTKITIKGTHEYQRFKMAAVAIDDVIDEILVDFFEDGADAKSENEVFELQKRGLNGFGTAHQLIKDLRVPTAHHNKWLQIKEDEKPVVGAKYNQYIVNYCAPSMANPGFTVVGQHNMSVTTHVFWVNQAIAEDFETELAKAGVDIEVVNEVTEEDGVTTDAKIKAKTAEDAGIDSKYAVNHEQTITDIESK